MAFESCCPFLAVLEVAYDQLLSLKMASTGYHLFLAAVLEAACDQLLSPQTVSTDLRLFPWVAMVLSGTISSNLSSAQSSSRRAHRSSPSIPSPATMMRSERSSWPLGSHPANPSATGALLTGSHEP